ncbi:MAG TPA: PASTA domain-containing protein [Acidimicrobiales bacterium]|nr:PASTA domain-containing protein [Acidimicrobiales bacterium]
MSTPRLADRVGRVLGGRFRLVSPIGSGASAHVFLAHDVVLGRPVAVKVLHPALAGDVPFLRRFRAEAQAAATLNHPHITQIFDWGEDDDGPYLVLEYLGGGSLRDMLDVGHRLSPAQAAAVGAQAANALDYAHRRGLVHRDVKPANFLFEEEGRLRIADFGLARALSEAAWTEPIGAMLGTARYASPEQVEGRRVDGRADVYALSLVLIEIVTGEVPFAADTTIATLMARVGATVPVSESLGPLAPILERAAAPDPESRTDARELAAGLGQVASQLPPPAPLPLTPPGSIVPDDIDQTDLGATNLGAARATAPPPTGPPPTGPPPTAPTSVPVQPWTAPPAARVRPRRRRRFWPVVVLAAVAILGGAAAAVLTTNVLGGGQTSHAVPSLAGADQPTAARLLRQAGLQARFSGTASEDVPAGTVVSWTPNQGLQRPGTAVAVVLSTGPAPRVVPDLTGSSYDDAAAKLQGLRLAPARQNAFSDTVAQNKVISTSPGPGASVARDSTVTLVVSAGPDMVTVPDVRGGSVSSATRTLEQSGLKVANVFGFADGQVFFTTPQPGSRVHRGSGVSLYVL